MTMVMEHGVSYRQACKEVSISRTTVQYQHHPKDDALLIEELQLLVKQHPTIGFWQCYYRMSRKGWIKARWGISDNNRRAKYYHLTAEGRRQFQEQTTGWQRLAAAVSQAVTSKVAPSWAK